MGYLVYLSVISIFLSSFYKGLYSDTIIGVTYLEHLGALINGDKGLQN